MSAQVQEGPAGQAPAPAARHGRVRAATFADVARSEVTKLFTVRSTWITLGVAVVLTVGIGILACAVVAHNYSTFNPSDRATFDPTAISLAGSGIAQVAFAVLGILVITSEYSTGMIRTSLTAVPRRGRLLGAKILVFAVVVGVLAEVLAFVSFAIGQVLLASGAPTAALGDRNVLRAVVGTGLYLMVLAVIAIGLGTLIRSTAGAITAMVALLFVLPGLAGILPTHWQQLVQRWWPTDAGRQVTSVVGDAHALGPWAGLADMCVFAAAVVVLGAVVLERRDA